jgi:iron complex outermembrane receptor protein
MTVKTSKLRDAIKFALAVGAIAGTGSAFAQDPAATSETETTELDRIEVTGSRIKRAEVETSQPIFSLSREDIQAQGLTSVGDVIQNLTANGSTLNTTFNNGGNGETRVSLRNLGSNRTLVLVNGRRWVGGTGLGGAVDLNTIPTAAVERIEVLKDGASAIYGSDAIAGVVNVILRNDYDGAEINTYLGVFDKGDGFRQSYDVTIGSTGDRFSAMFGAGYVKEEPVFAGDREISEFPVFGTGTAFGSSTTPDGRFAVCRGAFNFSTGGCTGGEGRPGPAPGSSVAGGTFTYDRSNRGSGNEANFRPFILPPANPNDIYNFAPDNYLITPQERISIFGRATVNLTDNVMGFVQATYNNRKSEQLLAAMPIVLGTGPGAGVQARTVAISRFNMYNPFGLDISRVQRRANETGGRSFTQNVDTYAFTGGLEGSFDVGDRFFSWDAGMVYGRNEQADTTIGLFNILALRNALGPSEMRNGVPTCVTTPGGPAILGCVPANFLGGLGSLTQEMLDYISFEAHDNFGYTMKQYFANVSGEIVELPGGMLAFAAGVERREESGFDAPDALIASGNTTGNARTPTKGAYDVQEAYMELSIPVLKDVPFAQELEFSLASRYSDYSNFGDTVNSKFGFKWRPIEDLLIRGNWAEGFRAPSIGELFGGISDSFQQISDPCNLASYPGLAADAQARCRAQGVPAGGYDQGNPQIRISVGGNPNLLPEKSESRTLGFVYSPSWFENFDISLDWWKIELEDTINTFGGQAILNGCIRDNNAPFCTLYSRGAGGAIDTLLSAGVNFGEQTVEGYDMTVNYRLPETAFGRFTFSWDTTYLADYSFGDGDNLVGEYQQNNNNWRIRSNLLARWEKGDWGATWSTRFYSRQDEFCQDIVDYGYGELCSDPDRFIDGPTGLPTAAAENKLGGTTYHDASIYTKLPWNAKVTLGVNNLFDKEPPLSFQAFANSFDPQYEVPGQFVYLQYNQKF